MDIAPSESRFETFRDYREAVVAVIRAARSQLAMFDATLSDNGLESREGADLLSAFLLNGRANRLRIILHRPETLVDTCPRLTATLRRFSHNAHVRQTPDEFLRLTDRFIIADGRHIVVRFHADHSRGKIVLSNEAEAQQWQQRFDALWEMGFDTAAISTLGL